MGNGWYSLSGYTLPRSTVIGTRWIKFIWEGNSLLLRAAHVFFMGSF